MSRFLVTTTIRHTSPGEPSGYLYTIDLDSCRVSGRCPVIEPPYIEADPNPRGGMRGAKGVTFLDDSILLANASVVYRFDAGWNCTGAYSHPSCGTIHDILWHDGGLWVTSCSNDLLFQFGLDGRILKVLNFRDCAPIHRALGWYPTNLLARDDILAGTLDFRDPRSHSHETHDGGHINSICALPNRDMLALLGMIRTRSWTFMLRMKNFLERHGLWQTALGVLRPSLGLLPLPRVARSDVGVSVATGQAAVVRIRPTGEVSVVRVLPDRRMPTHSLSALNDGTVLLADTTDGCLEHWDPDTGAVLARVKVTDEFLRGVHHLDGDRVVAGSQRDVLVVDLRRGQVLEKIRVSENPNVSVYDLKPLPDKFGELPTRLAGLEVEMETIATALPAALVGQRS